MSSRKIDNNVFIPMPVTLVGSIIQNRANFMTAGWVTRVNANPPWIGAGINRVHATPEGIIANKSFSICLPGRRDIIPTDYCGIASGAKKDKSSVFKVFFGDSKTAPLIEGASLNLECSLVQTVEGPTNYFFIGEIRGAYAAEECLVNGKIDPVKADYLMLTMPDNTYWSLGEAAGRAWSIGGNFAKP
jgi:flavin reductase (DIM6/NTAB) family NADH-FMN oxidoreductase RutF